jgi:hypothetical protein
MSVGAPLPQRPSDGFPTMRVAGVVIQRPDPRRTTVRHSSSRTQPRTDIDLALERTGSMRSLSAQDRAAFIRVADLLGCHTAAQHIRDDERRRERVTAAPEPAPRPGPKPQLTPARAPMLMVVPETQVGPAAEPDDERAWWEDARRIAERHHNSELSSPTRGLLDAVRRAATAHLR